MASQTHYQNTIQLNPDGDFNANFDVANDKATDIENWINNLALLNQNTQIDIFHTGLNISMFSNDEENKVNDFKVEKQMQNISQIANSSKIKSLQKSDEHSKRRAYNKQASSNKKYGPQRS